MNRLCTICARGGSKGVKNKNIRNIAGKALIAHSITQALESGLFDYVAVSSDSEEILSVAKEWGSNITIKRPSELSTDSAPKIPVIKHCIEEVEKITNSQFDTFVDLDATSPLRTIYDINESVKLLEGSNASNVITGTPSRRSPYFNLVEINVSGSVVLSKKLEIPVVRRQDAPKCYDMNASIYVWKRNTILNMKETLFFENTKLFIMPEERSIDIDTELDFKIVDLLLKENRN